MAEKTILSELDSRRKPAFRIVLSDDGGGQRAA